MALQTVYLPFTAASMPSERLCSIARSCGQTPARRHALTPVTRHQPFRRALFGLVLLATLVSFAISAAPAAAAKSCARQVIDDWWDGRIDGTYPHHCYDDAIEILPRDVRDYSSAEDDIRRALQAALRNEAAPPNTGGVPAGEGEEEKPDTTPPATTPDDDDPPPTNEGPTTDLPPGTETVATPPLDDSASSVPIPLLILAGLALLLVAGGSAGYLIRRVQARRLPPPAA